MDTSLNHILKFHITAMAPFFTNKTGSFDQVYQIELDMNLYLKVSNNCDSLQSAESNNKNDPLVFGQELPSSIMRIINDVSNIEKVLSGVDFQQNN